MGEHKKCIALCMLRELIELIELILQFTLHYTIIQLLVPTTNNTHTIFYIYKI